MDNIEILVEQNVADVDILVTQDVTNVDVVIEQTTTEENVEIVVENSPTIVEVDINPDTPTVEVLVNEGATLNIYPGGGGDFNFVYTQAIASAFWSVTHSAGKFPSVTIVDSGGTEIDAQVDHIDANNLTITFASSTTGKAYIN